MPLNQLAHFFVISVNHQKAPVSVREKVFITPEDQVVLTNQARQHGGGLLSWSTCNRTEIFSFDEKAYAEPPQWALKCLFKNQPFDLKYVTYLTGAQAVNHLFRVSSGLESQVLGDFQVVRQLKDAFKYAYNSQMINTFLSRLEQFVFKAQKRVRTETGLSDGNASVASAAVGLLRDTVSDLSQRKVLLLGAGKTGTLICENLLKHIPVENFSIANRSAERGHKLAERYNMRQLAFENLSSYVNQYDVIIAATGALKPIITRKILQQPQSGNRFLLDLSVPRNIEFEIGQMPHTTLLDLDRFEQLSQNTVDARRQQVTAAEVILAEEMEEFFAWLKTSTLGEDFKALKKQLHSLRNEEIQKIALQTDPEALGVADEVSAALVNKIAGRLIRFLKDNHQAELDASKASQIFKQTQPAE